MPTCNLGNLGVVLRREAQEGQAQADARVAELRATIAGDKGALRTRCRDLEAEIAGSVSSLL